MSHKPQLHDHLWVVLNKETGLYHGAYMRNFPHKSGRKRFMPIAGTDEGYILPIRAAEAIEKAFPKMPKIERENLNN